MRTRLFSFLMVIVISATIIFGTGCDEQNTAKNPEEVIQNKLGTVAAGALQVNTSNSTVTSSQSISAAKTSSGSTTPTAADASLAAVQAAALKAAKMDAYSYVHKSTQDAHWYRYLRLGNEVKRINYAWNDDGDWVAWSEYLVNLNTGDCYSYQYPKKDENDKLWDLAEHQTVTSYSQADLFNIDEVKWRSTELLDLVNGFIQNDPGVEFTVLKGTCQEDRRSVTKITSEKANIRLEIDKGFGSPDTRYDALKVDVIMDKSHGKQMFYLDDKTGMLICWGYNSSPTGTNFDQIRYYGFPKPDSVSAASMKIETETLYPKINIDPLNR